MVSNMYGGLPTPNSGYSTKYTSQYSPSSSSSSYSVYSSRGTTLPPTRGASIPPPLLDRSARTRTVFRYRSKVVFTSMYGCRRVDYQLLKNTPFKMDVAPRCYKRIGCIEHLIAVPVKSDIVNSRVTDGERGGFLLLQKHDFNFMRAFPLFEKLLSSISRICGGIIENGRSST